MRLVGLKLICQVSSHSSRAARSLWRKSVDNAVEEAVVHLRFLRTLADRLYRQEITMSRAQFPGVRRKGHLPGINEHHL